MLFILQAFLLLIAPTLALPNSMGSLPEMGMNSWYMLHHHLVNYTWEAGYVASEDFLAIAEFFKTSGLQALGYTWTNWDDCVVVGRDSEGKLIPDPAAFPKGPRYVSDALATMGFKMGWYTVRGNVTCAGSNKFTPIKRPGSNGYETIDAQTYAEWGITYLKDDTCGGPNVPYQIMGAALNASGTHTFYSLCEPGQGPKTAPIGRSIGNGWRIDEDDGGLWYPILDNVNMVAALYPYSGCDEQHNNDHFGCGWNDMGLLMVGGGMTPDQDNSHMALWAITATKLLISVDPRGFNAHSTALVSNPEIIAIDQDGLKLQGQRIIPPVNASRAMEDYVRIREWKLKNLEGGSWKAAGRSHELLHPEGGAIPGTEAQETLAAGGRVEVWQRKLVGGKVALLLFNCGIPGAPTVITCDGECWDRMGFGAGVSVSVRDVLSRSNNGTATNSFAAPVPSNGTVLVVLSPQ